MAYVFKDYSDESTLYNDVNDGKIIVQQLKEGIGKYNNYKLNAHDLDENGTHKYSFQVKSPVSSFPFPDETFTEFIPLGELKKKYKIAFDSSTGGKKTRRRKSKRRRQRKMRSRKSRL